MRCWVMAFSRVVLTCSWLISSPKDWGRYLRAITWYMEGNYARPRVIRGTRVKPLPLLPSGPGGVRGRPLHEARGLTTFHASRLGRGRDLLPAWQCLKSAASSHDPTVRVPLRHGS